MDRMWQCPPSVEPHTEDVVVPPQTEKALCDKATRGLCGFVQEPCILGTIAAVAEDVRLTTILGCEAAEATRVPVTLGDCGSPEGHWAMEAEGPSPNVEMEAPPKEDIDMLLGTKLR